MTRPAGEPRPLFPPGPAYVRGSETSREAAEAIAPKLGRLQEKVLQAIANQPDGLTDQEGQALTGLATNCYTPRRRELVMTGKVEDSGDRRRAEYSRCRCVVWRVKK